MTKTALVCGAGGFIGGHLVKRLKREGFWVRGVDLKFNEHRQTDADDFVIGDLRDQLIVREVIDRRYDEVYQLAADMGGAEVFSLGIAPVREIGIDRVVGADYEVTVAFPAGILRIALGG